MTDSIFGSIANIAMRVQTDEMRCRGLNLEANIEWKHRTLIRDMQGHLSKVYDAAADLLYSVDEDEHPEIAGLLLMVFGDEEA